MQFSFICFKFPIPLNTTETFSWLPANLKAHSLKVWVLSYLIVLTKHNEDLFANIWGEWLGGAETYDGNDVYNYIQKPNATLYLYNIPQNRMIKWNSHSNNAAILHIENSEVYYRINDTLYKAPILENNIGTPQVIYQSPILKHVNWLWK